MARFQLFHTLEKNRLTDEWIKVNVLLTDTVSGAQASGIYSFDPVPCIYALTGMAVHKVGDMDLNGTERKAPEILSLEFKRPSRRNQYTYRNANLEPEKRTTEDEPATMSSTEEIHI